MSHKKNSHTEKVLKSLSKRAARSADNSNTSNATDMVSGLRDQYEVIKGDILKLRDDLQKGYDMAKGAVGSVEKKSLLGSLFKAR